jgi:glycine cleavage system transcriptional repressor
MRQRYIMTAFGQDRVGIVADLTQLLFDLGCNLEDTNMTRLSDEFALILIFTFSEQNAEEELASACRRLEQEKGITTFFRRLPAEKTYQREASPTHSIRMEGIDKCGIVAKTSSFLARNHINIVTLASQKRFSPQSGTGIYSIAMEVEAPENMSTQEFNRGLQEVGEELHMEIQLEENR